MQVRVSDADARSLVSALGKAGHGSHREAQAHLLRAHTPHSHTVRHVVAVRAHTEDRRRDTSVRSTRVVLLDEDGGGRHRTSRRRHLHVHTVQDVLQVVLALAPLQSRHTHPVD